MMILRLALVAVISSSVAAQSASTTSLITYIFGDSLTEVGNNNYLQYSLARSDFPWYGIDFSGGQATGRFTNGRTIGDIICTDALFPSYTYAYKDVHMHVFSSHVDVAIYTKIYICIYIYIYIYNSILLPISTLNFFLP